MWQLHAVVDQLVAPLHARHAARLRCAPGCAGCCVDGLTVFAVEAARIEAEHPDVTIKYIVIPGAYTDIVNKLSLLYKSESTSPSIAELPENAAPVSLAPAMARLAKVPTMRTFTRPSGFLADAARS